jgi:hypothetical protein
MIKFPWEKADDPAPDDPAPDDPAPDDPAPDDSAPIGASLPAVPVDHPPDLSAALARLTTLEGRIAKNDEAEVRRKSRRDTWKAASGEAAQRRDAERKRKSGVRLPWRFDKLRS